MVQAPAENRTEDVRLHVLPLPGAVRIPQTSSHRDRFGCGTTQDNAHVLAMEVASNPRDPSATSSRGMAAIGFLIFVV